MRLVAGRILKEQKTATLVEECLDNLKAGLAMRTLSAATR